MPATPRAAPKSHLPKKNEQDDEHEALGGGGEAPGPPVEPPPQQDVQAEEQDAEGGDEEEEGGAEDEGGSEAARSEDDDSEYPSTLECPICQEPPTRPSFFLVPDADGSDSVQVFEYRDMYRNILTRPVLQRWFVKHPINGQFVCRDRALDLLHGVPDATSQLIAQERARRGLPLAISCVTSRDSDRMVATQVAASS